MCTKVVLHHFDDGIVVLNWTECMLYICCIALELIFSLYVVIPERKGWYLNHKFLSLHTLACKDGKADLDGVGVITSEYFCDCICAMCFLLIDLLRDTTLTVIWIHTAIRTENLVNKCVFALCPPHVMNTGL